MLERVAGLEVKTESATSRSFDEQKLDPRVAQATAKLLKKRSS